MKFESRADEILSRRAMTAFDRAVDDTLDVARVNARRHGRTGRFEASLQRTPAGVVGDRLAARVGSPMRSAKAKERGAYIQAQQTPYLVFDAGSGIRKVKAVRLPPRPVVGPAVARYPRLMAPRLREVGMR